MTDEERDKLDLQVQAAIAIQAEIFEATKRLNALMRDLHATLDRIKAGAKEG